MLPLPKNHRIQGVILGKPADIVDELEFTGKLESLGAGWMFKYRPPEPEKN